MLCHDDRSQRSVIGRDLCFIYKYENVYWQWIYQVVFRCNKNAFAQTFSDSVSLSSMYMNAHARRHELTHPRTQACMHV